MELSNLIVIVFGIILIGIFFHYYLIKWDQTDYPFARSKYSKLWHGWFALFSGSLLTLIAYLHYDGDPVRFLPLTLLFLMLQWIVKDPLLNKLRNLEINHSGNNFLDRITSNRISYFALKGGGLAIAFLLNFFPQWAEAILQVVSWEWIAALALIVYAIWMAKIYHKK